MASISVLGCLASHDECPGESAIACALSRSTRTESSLADTQGNRETSANPRARARPITKRRLDTPLRLVETRNHVKAATHKTSHTRFNREFAYCI